METIDEIIAPNQYRGMVILHHHGYTNDEISTMK